MKSWKMMSWPISKWAIGKYGIDLIEVIGHTEGMPAKRGTREMDSTLETMAGVAYDPDRPFRAVQGSDTDLGMLRALEAVKFLKPLRGQGKLTQIDSNKGLRAYSSGQLTLVDGNLSDDRSRDDDPARRRIEIRLTRLGERIQEHRGKLARPAPPALKFFKSFLFR